MPYSQDVKDIKNRNVIKKSICIFIIVMFLLTFFSNTINNLMLPRVQAVSAKNGTLAEELRGSGIVEAKEVFNSYIKNSLTVEDIRVNTGDTVKKGQVIMVLNKKKLEKLLQDELTILEQKKLALQKLQETSAFQAKTDTFSINEAERQIADTKDDLEQKKKNLENVRDLFKIGAETEVNLQKARNELAVAERLYKKALDEKNKPTQNLNIDIKSAELDIKLQKSRIDEIKDELETANNIAAPDDGVITALNCQKGSTLDPSVPLYTMSLPDGGFKLKVAVDSTKANYLVTGDEVEISINSLNEEKVKGKIIAITTPAVDKPGENNNLQKVIVIDLELKTLVGGEHADIYLKKETKNYEMLIPNEAVREERNDYYVFVIKESEGPLGKEYYIQKIKVFCEASDDSYTAVSGGLLFSDRVVFSSDKPLSEGDRVRITKGNKGSGV